VVVVLLPLSSSIDDDEAFNNASGDGSGQRRQWTMKTAFNGGGR